MTKLIAAFLNFRERARKRKEVATLISKMNNEVRRHRFETPFV
jgi:hypothetical protein